jgi:hypothetical protein
MILNPSESVDDFLRRLDHPLRVDFEAVRRIVLGASPHIHEGIKWNSVSFRTTEYFATINCRETKAVQLVFHLGAKVKDNTTAVKIADPKGLMKWLATERALVTVGSGREIQAHRPALVAIVRAWIRHV